MHSFPNLLSTINARLWLQLAACDLQLPHADPPAGPTRWANTTYRLLSTLYG